MLVVLSSVIQLDSDSYRESVLGYPRIPKSANTRILQGFSVALHT